MRSRALKVGSYALVLAVLVAWAFTLRPQSLGGPAGYVLVSGTSMNPIYHTGDMVLVERHSEYHVGDIIAYRVPDGDAMAGAQVIHRIIGGSAKTGWIVQGDNRTAPDVWRPHDSDIVGAAALHIPHAIVVLQWFRSPVVLALLAACFVFARLIGRDDDGRGEDGDLVELPARDELKEAA